MTHFDVPPDAASAWRISWGMWSDPETHRPCFSITRGLEGYPASSLRFKLSPHTSVPSSLLTDLLTVFAQAVTDAVILKFGLQEDLELVESPGLTQLPAGPSTAR